MCDLVQFEKLQTRIFYRIPVIMFQMRFKFVLLFAFAFLLLGVSNAEDSKSTKKWLDIKGESGPGAGQHIVFVTGEEFYRSEEGMPMFAKILSKRHGFDCTVLFAIDPKTGAINPNQVHSIPGIEKIADADLLVLFARFRELPDSSMKYIADHINAGKPVMGFKNATHPFRYPKGIKSQFVDWDFKSKKWPGGFGQQIFGDTWVSHHGKFQKEATLAKVNLKHANHPVLKGVSKTLFIKTDVNGVNKLTEDDTVLYHGHVLPGLNRDDAPVTDGRNDSPMATAWFKTYTSPNGKKGRSFFFIGGASQDFLEEDVRRLIVNAVYSLTGLEQKIPEKSNVDFVGEFKPTAFEPHTDDEWKELNLKPADFR